MTTRLFAICHLPFAIGDWLSRLRPPRETIDQPMEIKVLPDATAVAAEAAKLIARESREAVAARGRFTMAVSGGHTPWQMLRVAGAGGRSVA